MMRKILLLRLFWAFALITVLPALVCLAAPASRGGAWFALGACAGLAWLVLAGLGGHFLFPDERAGVSLDRLAGWIEGGSRRAVLLALCGGLGLLAFELFVFTWMFFPVGLRGLAIWLFCLCLQTFIALWWAFRSSTSLKSAQTRSRRLDSKQCRVLGVLGLLGLVYFAAFIPANLRGTGSAGEFLAKGGDEAVIYPILTTMLTPAQDLRTSLYRVVEYDDYHYGYPFYVLSALVLLPVRLTFGESFAEQYRLNLVLLRQLVSLLPLILSAIFITYLGTRFRSYVRSTLLFGLILSIPAVIHYGQNFWHPDGIAVLCVVLTFFFLERDELKLGRNFYLAALFCGLASAIRLVGFFFFMTVGLYLLAAWRSQGEFKRVWQAGLLFVLVMSAALILSNPFLFDGGARTRMMATMAEKSQEMAHGYPEPDPEGVYRTGWAAWLPFFERDYNLSWFGAFLFLSALAGVWSQKPLLALMITAWMLAMGGYMVYFVAVKSYQYSLPLFLPLFAAIFMIPALVAERTSQSRHAAAWRGFAQGGVLLLGVVELALNLYRLVG